MKQYLLASLTLFSLAILPCAHAKEETYIREYTYRASDLDSKVSSRIIALQQVKTLLLEELGTHVSAIVSQQSASDGKNLGKVDIETLSAGVTKVDILAENWNGSEYYLKAQLKADPSDVLNQIDKMLDAKSKQSRIDQLSGDLSKAQDANAAMADSLRKSNQQAVTAMAEIERLKQLLAQGGNEVNRNDIAASYQQQVATVTAEDLFNQGVSEEKAGNHVAAFKLYRQAADMGSASAQNNLGVIYDSGKGVTQDDAQAVYWYRKAADQGDATAQTNLGGMYAKGEGVATDYKQARVWWQKAADQGEASAQYNLGLMYDIGDGVAKNYKQAVYWYRKAADLGHANAQHSLGLMYDNGDGVAKNYKQAVYWYRKAADQGHATSQYDLGLKYAVGKGVAQDYKQALYWLQKAADQGDEGAIKMIPNIKEAMRL